VGATDITKWLGCQNPGEMDATDPNNSLLRNAIANTILTANGLPTVAAPNVPLTAQVAVIATPAASPGPATLASASGVITNGASTDQPVSVPTAQPSATFVFSAPHDPGVALTFGLLRPGGTPVATTDSDVSYDGGVGVGGLDETHYVITNPAPGTWTMRVTGTTVPLTGWSYDLQALVPGGSSVTASTGAGHYDVGQAVAFSADVAVNATPYAGATVNATITKPDNTTATVALTDAGGGAYTGSFGDTSACGLYQVTVTADGSDSGTPFSRQDRTIAIVGVPGNVIMDPCNADSDGDGITDRDEINVYHTNPANADTDGDGYTDKQEIDMGKDANTYCQTMRADVDGDGAVSILDLTRVAKYFAQTVPPAPARYDEDGDNKISILDLTKMAQVFTQHVSACP
jgi:hypothetical protein